MLRSSSLQTLLPVIVMVASLLLLSCGSDPTEPPTGRVQVAVYDQGDANLPVEGVTIRVLPTDVVAVTDENGLAIFDLPPGTYSVKADVCCIGPGWIRYDEQAAVASGRTTQVQMNACLACV